MNADDGKKSDTWVLTEEIHDKLHLPKVLCLGSGNTWWKSLY